MLDLGSAAGADMLAVKDNQCCLFKDGVVHVRGEML